MNALNVAGSVRFARRDAVLAVGSYGDNEVTVCTKYPIDMATDEPVVSAIDIGKDRPFWTATQSADLMRVSLFDRDVPVIEASRVDELLDILMMIQQVSGDSSFLCLGLYECDIEHKGSQYGQIWNTPQVIRQQMALFEEYGFMICSTFRITVDSEAPQLLVASEDGERLRYIVRCAELDLLHQAGGLYRTYVPIGIKGS